MNACLMRLDSLREDYSDCEDRCEGDACATVICKEVSRNVACLAIKARCTLKGGNTDPDYTRCCSDPTKDVECLEERSEAPCRVLPTTTTSTRPSSTTTVTVRTTTTTNTTI